MARSRCVGTTDRSAHRVYFFFAFEELVGYFKDILVQFSRNYIFVDSLLCLAQVDIAMKGWIAIHGQLPISC